MRRVYLRKFRGRGSRADVRTGGQAEGEVLPRVFGGSSARRCGPTLREIPRFAGFSEGCFAGGWVLRLTDGALLLSGMDGFSLSLRSAPGM